jgi:hypothetical protein
MSGKPPSFGSGGLVKGRKLTVRRSRPRAACWLLAGACSC